MATAQERIHALSGTVTSINPKIQMTEIDTDDGSSAHFQWLKKSDGSIDFDKHVSADATDADKFTTKGTHVIVYYFGEGEVRTVVALHDLGTGPMGKSVGTIIQWNHHDHLLRIKNSTGGEESFHLDSQTVVDAASGVVKDFKFDLNKGDSARVLATQSNGSNTALLIVPAIL
jgi:hypothetical protein